MGCMGPRGLPAGKRGQFRPLRGCTVPIGLRAQESEAIPTTIAYMDPRGRRARSERIQWIRCRTDSASEGSKRGQWGYGGQNRLRRCHGCAFARGGIPDRQWGQWRARRRPRLRLYLLRGDVGEQRRPRPLSSLQTVYEAVALIIPCSATSYIVIHLNTTTRHHR
ncbi:hypothetical protein CALVIDRAFT_186627 [Calocera viscosa TUFC12733]|uniref:Uncharacterized protein n=1 Tax=Calocera viscosa (strain TUFC12733) TaxID=1330018 RepID=A0A167KTT6_CALVF|nr:hypothetical protein CALVIDRAFT_186627 [Calocera viscosa TUFC12733]